MMLTWKLSYRMAKYLPYALMSLPDQIARCRLEAGSSHKTFTYRQSGNGVSKFQHGSQHSSRYFSTMTGTVLVQGRDIGKLCQDLETAIEERRFEDACNLHEKYMQMEGFPRKSIVEKFVTALAEKLDKEWVEKAFGLVERAFEEQKHDLCDSATLIYLSLALVRCGLPIPASTLLRKLVEMKQFPNVKAWSAILGYMCETSSGAYIAAELVLEIGYLFQDGRVDPRKKSNAPLISMKPNTTTFNIVLAGCLIFGTTRKAEQLLDMMPRINVKPDATLLIIMAHIYERNCHREEIRKLKRQVDEVQDLSDVQFRQFYNCLLSCHLKLGDLDAASGMVLEMLVMAKKAQNSLGLANLSFEIDKNTSRSHLQDCSEVDLNHLDHGSVNSALLRSPFSSFEDFCRDGKFLRLEAEAEELLDTFIKKLERQVELVTTERGILQPTRTTYVKLVKAFLEVGRIKDLAEFLIKAEKEDSPVSVDHSALVNVIQSCISLGWLDQAHDLLDEMCLAGVRASSSVYGALLKAYCQENRAGEVKSLLRDVRRAGLQLDASCYEALIQSRVLGNDTQGALDLFKEMKEAKIPRDGHQQFAMSVKGCTEDGLMTKLLQEIKEGQTVDHAVHDWNNVIHFFCKKRLMQDAEKALKKMRSLGHVPNALTFHSLVTGYAAIGGKYIEVAEIWGEMKSFSFSSNMKFDQELLDSLLYTFVRGGFFTRANEVVEMMEKGKMFIDKYKYRTLFLKYHRTLYKGKAPKFQTESQLNKREAALEFKRWVGL